MCVACRLPFVLFCDVVCCLLVRCWWVRVGCCALFVVCPFPFLFDAAPPPTCLVVRRVLRVASWPLLSVSCCLLVGDRWLLVVG